MNEKQKINKDLLNKLLKEKGMDGGVKKMLDENFGYRNSIFENENNQAKKVSGYKSSAENYVGLYT